MFRLDGKTALVTGAGSGIGQEIALLFARQGATLVVVDRDQAAAEGTAERIKAAGGGASVEVGDVVDEAQVERVFSSAVGRHGRLDVVVHDAGVSQVGNIQETSL